MRKQRHTTDRFAAPMGARRRTYALAGHVPSFVPVPVVLVPVGPTGTGVAPQE